MEVGIYRFTALVSLMKHVFVRCSQRVLLQEITVLVKCCIPISQTTTKIKFLIVASFLDFAKDLQSFV